MPGRGAGICPGRGSKGERFGRGNRFQLFGPFPREALWLEKLLTKEALRGPGGLFRLGCPSLFKANRHFSTAPAAAAFQPQPKRFPNLTIQTEALRPAEPELKDKGALPFGQTPGEALPCFGHQPRRVFRGKGGALQFKKPLGNEALRQKEALP